MKIAARSPRGGLAELIYLASVLLLAALMWGSSVGGAKAQQFTYDRPGQYTVFILGYDRSLSTDRITAGGIPPAYYYAQMRDEALSGKSGVRFFSRGCADIRIVKVWGLSGSATVLGRGHYAGDSLQVGALGEVPLTAGSSFKLCANPGGVSLVGLSFPRSAWYGGPDVGICFEVLGPPGTLANATQFGAGSPFIGRANTMCSLTMPALLADARKVWSGFAFVFK